MEPVRPFKRLTIDNHFNAVTRQVVVVAWAMNPAFREPGPYRFVLQRGRAATDDQWVDVATTVDQPWLEDRHPIFAQFDRSTVYRVVLTDGRGIRYLSQPVATDMTWGHADWRLMREIIRKETLVQHKTGGGGTRGWLLKRRTWGDPCPTCVDPETGAIRDSHCAICFGTGVVGGYYPPIEYWVTMNPSQRMKRLTGDEGLVTTVVETVRALAWPLPDQNDIWVQAGRNRRFRIGEDVVAQARHRGVDVILNLRLTELPISNIVYDIPTP